MLNTKSKAAKIISLILSVIFWILVWALLAKKVNIEFLLPSPRATVEALLSLIKTAEFWQITATSIFRIIAGILVAIALGSLTAALSARLFVADSLLSPIMTIIKATPIASFVVLAILWMDRNTLPIFITVLIVLPIVWANVSSGIRSVDKGLIEVAKIYRFSYGKRISKIYVPSIMPYFLAACKASLGMAWKAGIAAEVLCTPTDAIGTQIYLSKTYMESVDLFAWTLTVIILSIIIEKIFISGIQQLARKFRFANEEVRNA